MIITGTGKRTAESYNGDSSGAPLLHVEYTTGPRVNQPPVLAAGADQIVSLAAGALLDGDVTDDGLPDPPGGVTTTWIQLSGPGTVTFADPSAIDTTASFSEMGTYGLRLSADDGEYATSDQVTIVVNETAPQITTEEVRVAASSDDAEERSSGEMSRTSSDLELVYDRGDQKVGMRFRGVDIPKGAIIVEAYIQFQADETHSGSTSLTIQGEDRDDPAAFSSSSGNISSRRRTAAAVSWSPVAWTSVGDAGPDQRTPNVASVIQEIVDRPSWSSGNSLVIIVTGTGERTAESYDGDSGGAPLLRLEYQTF
jgi:hypothetical protein